MQRFVSGYFESGGSISLTEMENDMNNNERSSTTTLKVAVEWLKSPATLAALELGATPERDPHLYIEEHGPYSDRNLRQRFLGRTDWYRELYNAWEFKVTAGRAASEFDGSTRSAFLGRIRPVVAASPDLTSGGWKCLAELEPEFWDVEDEGVLTAWYEPADFSDEFRMYRVWVEPRTFDAIKLYRGDERSYAGLWLWEFLAKVGGDQGDDR